VLSMKLRMAAEGVDPVEELGSMAIDYGFDPEAAAALVEKRMKKGKEPEQPSTATVGSEAKAPKAKKGKTATDEILAARERTEGAGTTGGVGGRTPRQYSGHMAAGKTQREFDYLVNKAVNSGALQVKKGRRNPEFEDLMDGLLIEIPD